MGSLSIARLEGGFRRVTIHVIRSISVHLHYTPGWSVEVEFGLWKASMGLVVCIYDAEDWLETSRKRHMVYRVVKSMVSYHTA